MLRAMKFVCLLFPFWVCGAVSIFAGQSSTPVASEPGQGGPKLIEVAAAQKLIEAKKVIVLDVRTADEFAGGHIAGAKNVDFLEPDFRQQVKKLDKRQSYLVHCAVGGRSARASALMSKLGFESVYDLRGGLNAWEKAGKPVIK